MTDMTDTNTTDTTILPGTMIRPRGSRLIHRLAEGDKTLCGKTYSHYTVVEGDDADGRQLCERCTDGWFHAHVLRLRSVGCNCDLAGFSIRLVSYTNVVTCDRCGARHELLI